MDALLTGNWKHYVVVDQPHYAMFRHLQGPRREVLLTHDVLPGKMRLLFHMPFAKGRSVWWSRSAGFSIGWHLQQMVKIGMANHLSEDGLAYCDSDTLFLKPFDVASLTRAHQFRLYKNKAAASPDQTPNPAYTRAALSMLGLPVQGSYHGYVDNFVTWHRPTVLGLQQKLGENFNGIWQRAFRNRLQVSEYNLYGLYADHLMPASSVHFHTSSHLCRTHWARNTLAPSDVSAMCRSLRADEVMVGIQSFANVDERLLEVELNHALAQA